MGLAAYGKPKYYDKFRKIVEVNDDGNFSLNMKYFAFREKKTWRPGGLLEAT
jgi:predicted NodU family carbamoyl transferase